MTKIYTRDAHYTHRVPRFRHYSDGSAFSGHSCVQKEPLPYTATGEFYNSSKQKIVVTCLAFLLGHRY